MTPQEKDHYTKLGEHYNSDRDCNSCIHHTEKGCRKWDCEYEKLMSIQDAILTLRMVEAHGIADKAKETAIRSLEAWDSVKDGINDILETLSDCGEDWFTSEKLNEVLALIDKALGEVTDDDENSM